MTDFPTLHPIDEDPIIVDTTDAELRVAAEQLFTRLVRTALQLRAEDGADTVLEIGDVDADPHLLAYLRQHAAAVRGACDLISRAIADEWLGRWGESHMIMDNGHVLEAAASTRTAWQVVDEAGFCAWLRDQDDDVIVGTIAGVRTTRMGEAARDTFCEQQQRPTPSVSVKQWDRLPKYVQNRLSAEPTGRVVAKGPKLRAVPDPQATAERLSQDVPF